VPGSTSFNDLKSYHNITYNTFQAACVARGLLNDEVEYLECLREASQSRGGKNLRALLVNILAYNCPSNVARIWNELQEDFIEDFHTLPRDVAISMALRDIDEQLQKCGFNIKNYDLPEYEVPLYIGSKL
jgi:hypothetical protein